MSSPSCDAVGRDSIKASEVRSVYIYITKRKLIYVHDKVDESIFQRYFVFLEHVDSNRCILCAGSLQS